MRVVVVPSVEKIDIRAEDNVSSRVTVFRSAAPESAVAIIMPAMGVKASFYSPLANALVEEGLNVVTADLRGHGESSIRPGRHADFGYGEMVLHDWPSIVGQVKALFPHSEKIILGHSLGGQLTPLYLADNPGEIDRLIMVAAPSLYWLDWPFPRSVILLVLTSIFSVIAKVLGYFPGHRIGVGSAEAMRLMSDWARIARRGRYDMIRPGEDYVSSLRELRIPLLAISFSDDGFAPRRAVDRYCQKMPAVSLTRWHIAPEDLDRDTLGHLWWVNESETLAKRITRWVRGMPS